MGSVKIYLDFQFCGIKLLTTWQGTSWGGRRYIRGRVAQLKKGLLATGGLACFTIGPFTN